MKIQINARVKLELDSHIPVKYGNKIMKAGDLPMEFIEEEVKRLMQESNKIVVKSLVIDSINVE